MVSGAKPRIGVVGGTGKEGSGLALRWAKAGYKVCIGSRDGARGAAKAAELAATHRVVLHGGSNAEAITNADVVVLSVPFAGHAATVTEYKDALQGKVLVDLTVPLIPPKVDVVHLPDVGAAALNAQRILGEGVRVVGALHHVSSVKLARVDEPLDVDVLVVGDDPEAKRMVIDLMPPLGARGLDAGVLANAVALESLTPVLIAINKTYKVHSGIRITGF